MACTTPLKRQRVEAPEQVPLATTTPALQDSDFAFKLQISSDPFFLYFKGLVVKERTNKKNKAKWGAIGVAIFDSKDALVFKVSKPLTLPAAELTEQVAELEAFVQGLELARTLWIQYLNMPQQLNEINQGPKEPKVEELTNRAILLKKSFLNCNSFAATEKNAQLVLELARSSIAIQAGKPVNKIFLEKCPICSKVDVCPDKMCEVGGCRHRFCSTCTRRHVKLKVSGKELPRCPQLNCGLALDIDFCRKFLPQMMCDVLDRLVKESSIPPPERVYCPNPKCSYLMSKTEALANKGYLAWTISCNELTECQCLKCLALLCINCKVLWHSNMSCDAYKKAELDNAKLKELLTDNKKLRPCPRSGIDAERRDDQWVESICWEPRAFIYHNFLSKGECEHLIHLAKPNLVRSVFTNVATGTGFVSGGRTSSGASLTRGQTTIIIDIEKRIAEWTLLPVDHGERLHVLNYQVGQKCDPHFDYLQHERYTKNGGHRMATVLMYLSDVEEGGETVFPNAKVNNKVGISVKPKMGDALLFWNMKPDGSFDPLSRHAANPVIRGDKWSCTKWLHVSKHIA